MEKHKTHDTKLNQMQTPMGKLKKSKKIPLEQNFAKSYEPEGAKPVSKQNKKYDL